MGLHQTLSTELTEEYVFRAAIQWQLVLLRQLEAATRTLNNNGRGRTPESSMPHGRSSSEMMEMMELTPPLPLQMMFPLRCQRMMTSGQRSYECSSFKA